MFNAHLYESLLCDIKGNSTGGEQQQQQQPSQLMPDGFSCDDAAVAAQLWKRVSAIPNITSGRITPARGGGSATNTLEGDEDKITADVYVTLQLKYADLDAEARPVMEQAVHVTTAANMNNGQQQQQQRQRQHDKNSRFNREEPAIRVLPPSFTEKNIIVDYSPTRRRFVKFSVVQQQQSEGNPERRLEVWELDASSGAPYQLMSANLKAIHGAILDDGQFGQISWHPVDEGSFVYVAEVPAPETYKYFHLDQKDVADKAVKLQAAKDAAQPLALAKQHWGEQYTNFSRLGIFLCHINDKKVYPVLTATITRDFSAVTPVLLKNGAIMFVGHPHKPRRLGAAHCTNRPNRLFYVPGRDCTSTSDNADGGNTIAPTDITPPEFGETFSGKFLKVSPDGAKVAMFTSAMSGAHMTCCALNVIYLTFKTDPLVFPIAVPDMYCSQLIPVVETFVGNNKFPGLYVLGNRDMIWLDDGTIVVNSIRRSARVIYRVKIEKRFVSVDADMDHGFPSLGLVTSAHGTWTMLDAFDKDLLVMHSTAIKLPQVYLVKNAVENAMLLKVTGQRRDNMFYRVYSMTLPNSLYDYYNALESALVPVPDSHDSEVMIYDCSIAKPRAADSSTNEPAQRPVIVIMHGGPHITDTNSFAIPQLYFMLNGFRVISINYGGSLGFGQKRIDELLGNIGANDIADVLACVDAAVNRRVRQPHPPASSGTPPGSGSDSLTIRNVNGEIAQHQEQQLEASATSSVSPPMCLYGGSHGGFLATMLVGTYPLKFAAASTRNPVTCLSSMLFATDIPDWCTAECGPEADATAMYNMSPMPHAQNVRTPTLVGIGLNDLRVPITQGRSWYHAVNANQHNVDIRIMEYPGTGHAMDSVVAEADWLIQTVLFFELHVRKGTTQRASEQGL